MPAPDRVLPGRAEPMPIPDRHFVNGARIAPPWPEGTRTAIFALGCFWGAEKAFWSLPGVISTAVGYAGGMTPNPTYREACSGRTGHTESVLVAYDPERIAYEQLLKVFWEHHDPTQGMRQGNDQGTQYRSAIYADGPEQLTMAEASRDAYQVELSAAGFGADHDRDPRRRALLLRRGLPPAVPRQESRGLLPEPRDRREAAGRLRGHATAVRGLRPTRSAAACHTSWWWPPRASCGHNATRGPCRGSVGLARLKEADEYARRPDVRTAGRSDPRSTATVLTTGVGSRWASGRRRTYSATSARSKSDSPINSRHSWVRRSRATCRPPIHERSTTTRQPCGRTGRFSRCWPSPGERMSVSMGHARSNPPGTWREVGTIPWYGPE